MAFMKPQITEKQMWVMVDGSAGTDIIPADLVDLNEVRKMNEEIEKSRDGVIHLEGTILDEFTENTDAYQIIIIEGHGARLSAPGYLDATDWTVHDTPEEAENYLEETFGDDVLEENPDEDPEDDDDNPLDNPSRTTVSIWFDKDRFRTAGSARSWIRKYGRDYKMTHYSSDGFWTFPQMSQAKERRYRGKIRSKYISDGVLLKFVPSRFM